MSITYRDPKTGHFMSKAAYEATVAPIIVAGKAFAAAAVAFVAAPTPAERDANKLAYYLTLSTYSDRKTGEVVIEEKVRGLRDKSLEFNQDTMFNLEETRPLINGLLPLAGTDGKPVTYVLVSAEAKGNEAAKKAAKLCKKLIRDGWVAPNGTKYVLMYGYVIDSAFLLMVSENIGTGGMMTNLGLQLSASGKTAKRAKRAFAPYHKYMWGEIVDSGTVEEGNWFDVETDDGAVHRILDVNMSRFTEQEIGAIDGMNISNIRGYMNQALTPLSMHGEGKGLYWNVPWMTNYDMWIFGTKPEIRMTGTKFFLGSLGELEEHDLICDVQTMVNTGIGADGMVPDEGIALMNQVAETLFSLKEGPRLDMLANMAAVAKSVDPDSKWTLLRAAEQSIGMLGGIPAVERRFTLHLFKDLIDPKRGRTPIPHSWGRRLYACPNPNMFVNTAKIIDLDRDRLVKLSKQHPRTIFGKKVYYCCCWDMPEGLLAAGRSPNASGAEVVILWNVHLKELERFRWSGRIFFGADAGEILGFLNGGDLDDQLWVFANPKWVRRIAQKLAEYPLQPKLVEAPEPEVTDLQQANQKRHNNVRPVWTLNVLAAEMRRFIEIQVSLGSFINDISLDNMLSGDNIAHIIAALEAGNYVLPKNFRAPTLAELTETNAKKSIVPKWFHEHIPADYKPTEKDFVNLCIMFMKVRPNFLCKVPASNSDMVIDFSQQGVGNELQVKSLVSMAKEARKTLVFPWLTKHLNRVPQGRVDNGTYLMIKTEACVAIDRIQTRMNQILDEARRVEWDLKRQLPLKVRMAYPADEMIVEATKCLRTWWKSKFNEMTDPETGELAEDAYNKVANGWDQVITEVDEEGNVTRKETVHHHGLKDFYEHQFDGDMVPKAETWSLEIRRQILVEWLSKVYAYKPETIIDEATGKTRSVGDGVPSFMFNELFDIFEELELTGLTVFMSLKSRFREELNQAGVNIQVDAIEGHVYNVTNMQRISLYADPTLPDGRYSMTAKGVIVIKKAIPELRSDYKASITEALAEGDCSQFDY